MDLEIPISATKVMTIADWGLLPSGRCAIRYCSSHGFRVWWRVRENLDYPCNALEVTHKGSMNILSCDLNGGPFISELCHLLLASLRP